MIFSLITIALVGLLGYIWSSRGFFSAFVHLVCVIAAGGIAMAVWEPAAYFLLTAGGGGFLTDLAWGAGLALPFAISLGLLRLSIDALLPANLDFDGIVNIIGGVVCGLISGIITVGMLVLSVGSLRMGTELIDYRPVKFDNNGSLVRGSGGGFFRADALVAGFYSMLSGSTFRPLSEDHYAFWRPDLADDGPLLRTNFNKGTSRHTMPPNAFEVITRYSFSPGANAADLTKDTFDPRGVAQSFTNLDGTPAQAGNARIEGFVVRLKAGAREASGRVVMGNAQVRLVAHSDAEERSIGIQPLAVISQGAADKPELGRWRYDAPDTYIASVGGRDDAPMGFEFLVPKGFEPVGLMVKGVRQDVRTMKAARTFTSLADRDAAVRDGTITPTANIGTLDRTRTVKFVTSASGGQDYPIRIGTAFPSGLVLQKDTTKELTRGGESDNEIIGGGLAKFTPKEMTNQGAEPKLQVRQFGRTEDTQLVQITVDLSNKEFGLLSTAAAEIDREKPIVLIDSNGAPYTPVGYIYKTPTEIWVQFDPGRPVQKLSDMPALSRSQPDQRLTLLFRVSRGVKITSIAVGDKLLAEFDPALDIGKN